MRLQAKANVAFHTLPISEGYKAPVCLTTDPGTKSVRPRPHAEEGPAARLVRDAQIGDLRIRVTQRVTHVT